MNVFIKQLLSFTLCLVLFLSGIFGVLDWGNKQLFNKYKISPEIRTLIIGDSHTQYAIDDKILDNALNISQSSEGYMYSYYKLSTILKNNPQVNTVVLGYSYHNSSSYYDDIMSIPEYASRYFFIVPLCSKYEILKANRNRTGELISSVLKQGKGNLLKTSTYTFIGKFENITDSSLRLNERAVNRRIRLQYYDSGRVNGLATTNLRYLEKIIDLCNKAEVRLILLNTPLHRSYIENVPAIFKEYNKHFVKKHKIQVIDLEKLYLPDSLFLPDGDHVSLNGAIITSRFLKKLLENIE